MSEATQPRYYSSLSDESRIAILNSSFSEVVGGDFLLHWDPPFKVANVIRTALRLAGRYQKRMVWTQFRKQDHQRRRQLMETLIVPRCLDDLVEQLGEAADRPSIEQLNAAIESAMDRYPLGIIRLALAVALSRDPNSPGVIDFALCSERVRLPLFPNPEPLREREIPEEVTPSQECLEAEVLVGGADVEPAEMSADGIAADPEGPLPQLSELQDLAYKASIRLSETIVVGRNALPADLAQIEAYQRAFLLWASTVVAKDESRRVEELTVAGLEDEHRRALEELERLSAQPPFADLAALVWAKFSGTDETTAPAVDALRSEARRLSMLSRSEIQEEDVRLADQLREVERLAVQREATGQSSPSALLALSRQLPEIMSPIAFLISTGSMALVVEPSDDDESLPVGGVYREPEQVPGAAGLGVTEDLPKSTDQVDVPQPKSPLESTTQAVVSLREEHTSLAAEASVGDPEVDGKGSANQELPASAQAIADSDLASRLLLAQHFGPLKFWLLRDGASAGELPHEVAEAAAYLVSSSSPFDDCAYSAASIVQSLNPADLRSNGEGFALASAVAFRGARQTGLPGFTAYLSQLINVAASRNGSLEKFARALAQVPFGGIEKLRGDSGAAGESNHLQALRLEQQWAAQFLDTAPQRRLNFRPAMIVWMELVHSAAPSGRLASAAKIVADNDRTRVLEVRLLADEIRDRSSIAEMIDMTARSAPRSRSGETIDGRARGRLVEYIAEVGMHLDRWLGAFESVNEIGTRAQFAIELTDIDDVALERAFDELFELQSVPATSAVVCRAVARGDLQGVTLHSGDIGISSLDALRWEMDCEPSIPSGEDFEAEESLTIAQGEAILSRDLKISIDELFVKGELRRLQRLGRVAEAEMPQLEPTIRQRISELRSQYRVDIVKKASRLETLLGQARGADLVPDHEASAVLTEVELARLEADADPAEADPQAAFTMLVKREEILIRTLSGRVDLLREAVSAFGQSGELDEGQCSALFRRLDAFDIRTVEEQVARIEEGSALGSASDGLVDLKSFFPGRVSAAAQLRPSWQIAESIERGLSVESFDFSNLSEDDRKSAATAMRAWADVHSDGKDEKVLLSKVSPLMRAIGLEYRGQGVRPKKTPDGAGRLWIDFEGINRAGRAMIPQFGSALLSTTFRVLFLFEDTTGRRIVELARSDNSGKQVLVVYLPGVLAPDQRRVLANACRRDDALVPVVDLATFLDLLSSPNGQRFERLVHLVLPFTWVNPYVPNVQGRVPREMFFGREAELKQVLSRTGPAFVYGGRQLGKSALLRRAESEIVEREADSKGLYIDLIAEAIGSFQPPTHLWEVLADQLEKIDVPVPKGVRGAYERVEAAITTWLDAVDTRRILILLDEADAFLEQDFNQKYPATQRIRGLIDATDRRCKIVLAGLNSVQRFDRGTNHPMAHIAASSVEVGPLRPQDAFRLVHEPLRAIGLRFADDSEIYRILASTNDQASLIQLVCERLVETARQRHLGPDQDCTIVTAAMIDQLLSSPETKREISRRFEWTVSLDARYQVIAYRMALDARRGMAKHGTQELLALARGDWPHAFSELTSEEFSWYLLELETFGILRRVENDWLLRSPNLISLVGSPDEIEKKLSRLAAGRLDVKLDPTRIRFPLSASGAPGPLAGDQAQRVGLGGEPVTVLVASELSGLAAVSTSLEHLAATRQFELLYKFPKNLSEMPHRMKIDRDSGSWRIEVADLTRLAAVPAAALVASSLADLMGKPSAGASRVIVARPDQLVGVEIAESVLTSLRCWDVRTLKNWFASRDLVASDDELESVIGTTGGWYAMLQPGLNSAASSFEDFSKMLDARTVSTADLVVKAGLENISDVAALMDYLGDLVCPEADLRELLSEFDLDAAIPALRRAGILVQQADGWALDRLARRVTGN